MSLEEARTAITEVKSQVEQAKQSNITAKQQIASAQAQMNTQKAVRSATDLNTFKKRQEAIGKISSSSQQVSEREKYIEEYETQTLKPAEEQLKQAEQLQSEYNRQTQAFAKAQSAIGSKYPSAILAGDELAWEYYSGLRDNITNETLGMSIESAVQKIAELGITDPTQIKQELENKFGIIVNKKMSEGISDVIKNSPYRAVEIPKIEKPVTLTFNPDEYKSTSMLGLVSASPTQSIKAINDSNKNGFGSITGNAVGGLVSDNVRDSSSSVGGSWVDRTIQRAKEVIYGGKIVIPTKQESFVNPTLGFASASVGTGISSSGTLSFRPETIQEKQARELVEYKSTFFIDNPSKILAQKEQFNKLTFDLNKLNQEELTNRLSEISKLGANVQAQTTKEGITYTIEPPTTQIGFGANKKNIPVTDINENTQIGVGFYGIRRSVSDFASSLVPKEGLFKYNVKATIEPRGTVQYDNLDNPIYSKTIETTKPLITPEGLGKVAVAGLYAVPLFGSALFFTEVGGKIAESSVATKSLSKGVVTFAKESPVEASVLGLLGGAKFFSWGKQIKVIKNEAGVTRNVVTAPNGMNFIVETAPQSTKATAIDEIMPVIFPNEKMGAMSKFKLKVEQPVETATAQSRFSSFFFSPEEFIVKKARTDIVMPPKPILTDESGNIIGFALVGANRQGSNLFKFSRYEGQQIPLDLESFKSLSPTQKLELQRIAEAKTRGIPVSINNVPMILGKDFKYSTGGLITTRLGRSNLKTGNAYVYDYGRRVVRSEVTSQARPITSITKEMNGIKVTQTLPEDLPYELFRTTSAVKSSIKTSQRVSGKVDIIEGTSKVWKEPKRFGGESLERKEGTGNVINGRSILDLKPETKQVTQKAQQTIKNIQADISKSIPQNKMLKEGKDLLAKAEQSKQPILSPRQEAGAYAGLGLYERTEEIGAMQMPSQNIGLQVGFLQPKSLSQNKILSLNVQEQIKTDTLLQQKVSALQMKDLVKVGVLNKVVVKSKLGQEAISKLGQVQALKLGQKLALKQTQKQVQKQIQKQQPKQINKILKTKTTKKSGSQSDVLLSGLSKLSSGFRTYVLRKGQKEYLSGVAPRGQALEKGAKRVMSDLSATFGVEKTKQLVQGIDSGFKPSKLVFRDYKIKGSNRVNLVDEYIQKAGTRKEGLTIKGARLASLGERKELRSFRKKRGFRL